MAPWLANGLIYASALALTAGGITLLYITTRTFNFAHASMATVGFYVVYSFIIFIGGSPYRYFPFAFLFGALLGVICYYGLNRPLLKRQASEITLMMSTLGYDLILLSLIQMYCDFLTSNYKLFPRRVNMNMYDLELFGINAATIILPLMAIICLSALHLFLGKTKFGVAMKATIENPVLAGASGINSDRVYMVAWLIGGGMASLGGAAMAMAQTGTPVMGMNSIPFMFAGAILGGLHSLYGGILGGFMVGLAEYAGVFLLSQKFGPWILGYRMGIPLLLMAITLLIFPRGLAGIPWADLFGRLTGKKRGVQA
ncbi:MAG TPA: branched-chain amino acid ABC transporter permease [Bacillota bacterium]|nr:branched-chain amino acid ABC transporter permease [Bacillota bacterium]